MNSLKTFFSQKYDSSSGVSHKNNLIKRSIVAYLAINGEVTLAELTKELHVSIPTITKLVSELALEGIVADLGKIETPGGRRPNIFGLVDSAIYFIGVEISRDSIRMILSNLKNEIEESIRIPFALKDTQECMRAIVETISDFTRKCTGISDRILGIGVSIVGRVNETTQRTYKYFSSSEVSLKDMVEASTGMNVMVDNNARARCYAEYFKGNIDKERNILYLHLGRGIAIGIIIDGKLYYGKSGFSGEFGHIPFFDNEIICECGKKGCLETEVSGIAIERKMAECIAGGRNTILKDKFAAQGKLHINDIIEGAKNEDNLSIELIEEAGEKIGKSVAFLINTFNPELVIMGGNMSKAGNYLMMPMLSTINKYSLSLVYDDTNFKISQMDDFTGALGMAMLIRNRIIGL